MTEVRVGRHELLRALLPDRIVPRSAKVGAKNPARLAFTPLMTCPSCQAESNPTGAGVCFSCGGALAALTQARLIDSRYEILGLLGEGGMGIVYRAHDRMLDELVALKVLRSEYVDTPAMAGRFRSEIKLARKVSHPNVCRIHGYGQDAGTSYISMEFLEGVDLRQALAQHPEGLPREEAFSAALQIAKGLAAIHEVGVIHRDLKTPNVMRDSSGAVKLMDFGIARSADGSSRYTKTGQLMGTPEYMSPEQCRGKKLDFRSDVYALGIVIYELFTGELPFRGENIMATLFKQISEAVPFDGPAGSRLPPSLVPVIEKALAKAPPERFQSVADLYAALRSAKLAALGSAKRHHGAAGSDEPASIDNSAPRAPSTTAGGERRIHSRLDIHVDVYLCRLDSDGAVLHQERTIADILGRRGACVKTSVLDLAVGDSVVLREVSGDFTTPALVRDTFVGRDKTPRVGLEFVGKTAPDRLVGSESERLQQQRPVTRVEPRPAAPAATATPGPERRHSRLTIAVEIALRRLHAEDSKEERTVADNIGRGGARVLTSMTDLRPGDRVALREIGGDFATDAIVRASFVGGDGIPRLGLEFVGNTAPDRLVPSDGTRRTKPRTATAAEPALKPAVPKPTTNPALMTDAVGAAAAAEKARHEILELYASLSRKNYFEVLGIGRRSSEEEVKKAYLAFARRYHPDAARDARLADLQKAIQEIFLRVREAHAVLADTEQRARYEEFLGPDRPLTGPIFESDPAAPPTAETEEQRHHRIETSVSRGKRYIAETRYWDAVQVLEPLLAEPVTGRLNGSLRLPLAQALAKHPQWLKRAEELVIGVLRDDPGYLEAYFALALVRLQAGLTSPARVALRKVLEISPGNEAAITQLQALDDAEYMG